MNPAYERKVLEKAINKAHAKGWDSEDFLGDVWDELTVLDKEEALRLFTKDSVWRMFIYNHDFAKALWGEECRHCRATSIKHGGKCESDWHYHLQQMVIADHPIKYLGDNT